MVDPPAVESAGDEPLRRRRPHESRPRGLAPAACGRGGAPRGGGGAPPPPPPLGEPWTPEDARGWLGEALAEVDWVHAGALWRGDFPAETLAELRRGRRLSLPRAGGPRAAPARP